MRSHIKVKALNYTDLMEDCKDRGWCAWLFPVEVCSLKFQAEFTVEAAHKIRNLGKSMQNSNKKTGKAAEVEAILLDMALWR